MRRKFAVTLEVTKRVVADDADDARRRAGALWLPRGMRINRVKKALEVARDRR